MTRRDLEIHENRIAVAIHAGHCCEVCGRPLTLDEGQCAHRIPQRKANIEKYTEAVIQHPLNMRWTCPGACNDAVSIGAKPMEQELLAKEIRMRIMEDAAIRIQVSPHLYKDVIGLLGKVARGER